MVVGVVAALFIKQSKVASIYKVRYNVITAAFMAVILMNVVFLVVKGEKNLYEIVELTRAKGIQQGTNILYKLSLEQPLRIDKATATMYLLVINAQDGSYMISSQFKVKITCEKYKIARSVYLSQQVGQKVQYLYTQMLALTEENRKIANELKKGDTE